MAVLEHLLSQIHIFSGHALCLESRLAGVLNFRINILLAITLKSISPLLFAISVDGTQVYSGAQH